MENDHSEQRIEIPIQIPDSETRRSIKPTKARHKIRKATTKGFERAQWEQAQDKVKKLSVCHFKNQKVPYSIDIDHFRIYGPGIFLFFNFSKKVIYLFLILIAISFIPLVYNALIGVGYSSTKDSLSKYLSVLTIGNLRPYGQKFTSLADKLINAIPTFFVSVLFFGFYIYLSRKSDTKLKYVRSSIKMLSYKTVQVIKFPQNVTQTQLLYYMQQFGQVKQISTVKNYNETIFYCRKIFDLTLDGKEMILQRQKLGLETDEKFEKQIQKKEQQLQELYAQLQQEDKISSGQVLKYFVTFQSPQERDKALEIFQPYMQSGFSFFKREYPEQLKLRGEEVIVTSCHTEPGGIIWENVHVTWRTRWLRLLLQLLLIAAMIFLSFCFILILNVLNPPITTSHIDSSAYTQTTILTVSDQSIVRSWCLNNNNLVQQNPQSDYSRLCSQYLTSIVSRIFISIGIALGIMFTKYVLKYTVLYLSKFMRYKTYTEQVGEMTKNLFITYFFSTVFITIFMQAKLSDFHPKDLVKHISTSQNIQMNLKQMNSYNDLTNGWYLDVGYQIWVTWFIMAITYPVLIATYHYPLEKLCRWLAERQILERKMQNYLMPEEFQIADHYANLALFIVVGITFSPGMPSLIIVTGIGLIVRYFYFKFVFIRFSRIPKSFDESLNTILLRLLAFGIFSHLILAIWMYGVDELFDHRDSFLHHELYSNTDDKFKVFWLIVVKRAVDSWYLSALLVFYVFYFFVWEFLRELYLKCIKKKEAFKASPEMLKATIGNEGYVKGVQSQRSLTDSYKIQNNPDYFDILAIMQRRQLVSTIRPKIFT